MALQISLSEKFDWFHQLHSEENAELLEKPHIKDFIKFVRPHIIEIKKFPITLGRHDNNNLVIDHKSVSRKHAEIFEKGLLFKSHFIKDLGSSVGTIIVRDGSRVIPVKGEPIKINRGDEINLGWVSLKVL